MLLAILAALLSQQPPSTLRVPNAGGGDKAVYRTLQPGEQRQEALLRRIVCPGRGPVTLVTKQGGKVVQYTAATLSAVEFIDYRQPPRGAVSCEGFGAGQPVYITWKPEGQKQRAVAVEFLPK
jgi:hypothetical protein